MKVVSRVFVGLVLLIVIAVAGLIALIWPEGKVSPPGTPTSKNLTEVFQKKFDVSSLDISIAQRKMSVNSVLGDAELKEIFDMLYQENKAKIKELGMITAYQPSAMDGFIRVKVNLSIAGVIPAQATIDAIPTLSNGKLGLTVRQVRLGRLNIPVEQVMGMLKLDPAKPISFPISGIPSSMSIGDLRVSRGMVSAKVTATVRNMNDLQSLARSLSPEIYSLVMKAATDAVPASSSP